MYICNVEETAVKNGNQHVDRVKDAISKEDAEILILGAAIEADIAELEDFEERKMFLDDLGLDEPGVSKLIKKAYNRGVPGLPQPSQIAGGKAAGLIPNFSPLGDAITRERAAGVPASAIRVGSSPALKGPSNPAGLGVYNTIHEPAGLNQGISRSRRMGINPKSHGVPNFADGFGLDKKLKDLLDEAKTSGLGYRSSHGKAFTPSYSTMKAGLVGAHSSLPPSYFDSFKKEAAEVKAAKDL